MKKLISIILSLMLIMSTLPMMASAETTTETIVATDDCPVRNFSDAGKVLNTEYNGRSWIYTEPGRYTTPMYYKFNLPEVPEGQAVTNATFKVKYKSTANLADAYDFQVGFYPVDADWSQDSLTYNNQPLEFADLEFPEIAAELIVEMPKNRSDAVLEYDLTSLVTKHIASGSENAFSFAMIVFSNAPNSQSFVYTLENEDASCHPTLTLTTDVITAPEFLRASVENGATIDPATDIEFIFNNSIGAANITVADFVGNNVAISEDEYSFNGNSIVLTKDWDAYGSYTVTISDIADVYGQSAKSDVSFAFKTGADTSKEETVEVMVKDTQWWTSSHLGSGYAYYEGAAQNMSNGYTFPQGGDYKQNGYTVYRFELPDLGEGKVISSATLSYWQYYEYIGTDKWFVVPFGTWTEPSTTWDNEYVAAVEAAAAEQKYIGSYSYNLGNGAKIDDNATVDITSTIKDTVASGEDSIALSFHGGDSSGNTYTRYLYHELNSGKEPKLIINCVSPEFAVVSSNPEKGGKMNGVGSPVEMTLATTLTEETEDYKYADYIKLVNASDNSEVAAAISFDAEASKLTVTPSVDLTERAMYKIIFKAGLKDAYGSELAEDMTATAFTTMTGLEFYGIKFTTEDSPVFDECEEIDSYTAGSDVTAVAKIKNGSSKDLDAIMLVAIYGENNRLVAAELFGGTNCAPANMETQFSRTISVPEDADATYIKAFIWDNVNTIRPIFEHVSIAQAK